MYEVFNRLNSGGINLRPQEIRTSMYHSTFYEMLYRINAEKDWRKILNRPDPDLHMKDIEILLRGFAMLIDGPGYAPSMVKFLNQFSRKCETHSSEQNDYLESLFLSFLNACSCLPKGAFTGKMGRFNVALYEAVFTAACEKAFVARRPVKGMIFHSRMLLLEDDENFVQASQEGTTQTAKVQERLKRARAIMGAL